MSTIPASFLAALIFMVLAITVSFAMASLVFWQAPTQRINIVIGTFLTVSGVVLLLNFFIRLGYIIPNFDYVQSIVYVQLYLLPLLSFLLFVGIVLYTKYWSDTVRQRVLWGSGAFLLVFYIINTVSPTLLLSNFDTLGYLPGGELELEATPLLIALQVGTLIWGVTGMVITWRADTHRYLFWALFLMFSVGFLDTVPFLRNWNLNSLIGLVGRLLLTFAILDDNLFNPLKVLNQQLIDSQENLKQAYNEVEGLVQQRTHELAAALSREQDLSAKLEVSLQQEEELSQLKSHIIETVSHEFRTPMTVIQVAVDLLDRYDDRLTQAKKEIQFERIKSQIFYLTDLLRDTVFVSQVRAKVLEPEWQSITFEALEYEIKQFIDREEIIAPLITFKSHVSKKQNILLTDLDLVKRFLINLLINAFKYGDGKPILLVIDEDDAHWSIYVKDQGIGIVEQDMHQLFDLFYRGSNVETRRGLGLGLNIVQEIVTALNGQIAVASEGPNKGSCFTAQFSKAEPVPAQVQPLVNAYAPISQQ